MSGLKRARRLAILMMKRAELNRKKAVAAEAELSQRLSMEGFNEDAKALSKDWNMKPQTGWTTEGICTRVIDGDTVEVEIKRTLHVRLLDCWAPESRTRNKAEKALGLASKAALKEWIEGKPVTLQIPTHSQTDVADILTMGRVLGHLWTADGMNVSESQVANGFATREKAAK